MSRSMRKHAETLIGKYVVVYHVEGAVYQGVLHSVSKEGIYLSECHLMNGISAHSKNADVHHAISDSNELNADQVFFPFFFVPFAFLTGVAAANIARPPYYPYGYGYGGYPGYGYGGYGPGYPPYW